MSLPVSAPRQKLHRREILIEGFEREDGNFDIDAILTDTKTMDFRTDRGALPAGAVLHGLAARMTIDDSMTIVDFVVAMDDTPSSACETAPANFNALIGLSVGPGFVRAAYEKVGGTLGCTHIREMLQQMGTVAYQSLFQLRRQAAAQNGPAVRPALLDSCHGWRADGDLIRRNYPAFYRTATPHQTVAEREGDAGT